MADNSAQKPLFDVAAMMATLKVLAQQNSPIHSAISQIHNQFRSQPTPSRVFWNE